MSEIPKDGIPRLCWHKKHGHTSIFIDEYGRYRFADCGIDDGFVEDKNVIRWMDEMGVWHEIEHKG